MTDKQKKLAWIRKEKALKYFNGLKDTIHLRYNKHHIIHGLKALKTTGIILMTAIVYEFIHRIENRFPSSFDDEEYQWIAERI